MLAKAVIPYFEELIARWEQYLIIVDIDGTLVPDEHAAEVNSQVIDQLRRLGSRNQVVLCSNGGYQARNKKIAAAAGVALLETSHRKPSGKIKNDFPPHNGKIVVIGDKFLTDFLFAKNIGAAFILVRRHVSGHERLSVKCINAIDDVIHELYQLFIK